MLLGAASTVILDHHVTAQADLEQFRITLRDDLSLSVHMVPGMLRDLSAMGRPPCVAFFDMDQSGAALTWRFCFPDTPTPWLIRLVEDRDLWRFNLDQTEAFSSLLRSHDYDFETWNDIHEALEDQEGHDILMLEARGILRFYQQQVKKQAASAYWTSIAGHDVPTVNCFNQLFASDVGHALLDAFPAAPFVATWSAVDGAMGFSLRSQDHRLDVSQIARRFGGGGHRNAAGFTLPRP
ncbi:DHHA1 domain-containing protein [Novosphingobium sp. UBA1939]|uniref:DHHA1 domain-containing protein n=1 Tax=Novosphingobium sp. UBA1939 TaxID=1946982 RepID=UPI0025F13498|nr:DHHA1 domain-containing protein [Novosphingobium sp. UBA1939]